MKIANQQLLNDFIQSHARAAKSINKWVQDVKNSDWKSHTELKRTFGSADYVKNGRYVFNIGGNNYRIVAVVVFVAGTMVIRWVGTHADYNKIDSSTI